jgi:hypothetical protein
MHNSAGQAVHRLGQVLAAVHIGEEDFCKGHSGRRSSAQPGVALSGDLSLTPMQLEAVTPGMNVEPVERVTRLEPGA